MPALPPFRLDLTVWALRRRPDNAVDVWDGHTYRRALTLERGTIELEAVQDGSSAAPRLTVTLTGLQLDRQTETPPAPRSRACSASSATFPRSTGMPKATRLCGRSRHASAD